jgi:hypothetical protein
MSKSYTGFHGYDRALFVTDIMAMLRQRVLMYSISVCHMCLINKTFHVIVPKFFFTLSSE